LLQFLATEMILVGALSSCQKVLSLTRHNTDAEKIRHNTLKMGVP
jgi:hypothetical protein